MKKALLILIVFSLYCGMSLAVNFSNEKLHYVISYKWGLIHKDAGDATLTLKHKGNNYDVVLAAKTKPWADRFYEVRDTLLCTMKTDGLDPVSYKKSHMRKASTAVMKYPIPKCAVSPREMW